MTKKKNNKRKPSGATYAECPDTKRKLIDALKVNFSGRAIPLITIDETTLNGLFPKENRVVLSGLQYSVSSTKKISSISFNSRPKFVGNNVTQCVNNHKPINLKTIKHKKLIILSLRTEWYGNGSGMFTKSNGFFERSISKHKKNAKVQKEDEYIIMMIGSGNKYDQQVQDSLWSSNFVNTLKSMKSVNMVGNGSKHHQSYGRYYGLGIINKFSSEKIGEFSNRKLNMSNIKQVENLKSVLKQDFEVLHHRINRVIPNGTDSSFSLMTTMVDIVNDTSNDKVSSSVQMLCNDNVNVGNGCLTGYVCENAETKEYHQESDNSYTCIGIPYVTKELKDKMGLYQFQFKWNMNNEVPSDINVGLHPGTLLFYSGFCVYHRQTHCTGPKCFWNISSYHNSSLYSHVKGCTTKANIDATYNRNDVKH